MKRVIVLILLSYLSTANFADKVAAAQNPAAQNPAAQNPATQNPAAQNPAAQNPAAQNPATQNPAAQNPAAQNPATQNPAAQNPAAIKPNIVMIMIDDLGWMDLACQGNKLVETPNIDRFAGQGMRFTSNYSAAPVCSPTRAAVMTGMAPARLHLTTHIPDRFFPNDDRPMSAKTLDYLPLEHTTIAERFSEAGYATAFFGKWHLSGNGGKGGVGQSEFEPQHQGFDINVGGCCYGGPPSFFSPYRIHNLPDGKEGEYLPDRLADEAIDFMRAKREQPFMIFLWNYTVHWPMQAPETLLKKYESRKGPGLNDTRYGAMIEAMDTSIGRVLDELDKLKLADNTLVVFTSDNGGFSGVADNRPLRESKGHLYEGGIRVPMIARWPGRIPAGKVNDTPVVSTDLYPTFLAAANLDATKNHPLDGENILPVLQASGDLKRSSIFFHYPNYAWHMSNRLGSAVRSGQWKLLEWFDDGSVELYNLKDDLSETKNVADNHPAIAKRLQAELHQWRKSVNANMPTHKTKDDKNSK
ncbi:MAG: arylsulfatase A [Pirellulaceae bacterium]|jgi:arylsulfatase A